MTSAALEAVLALAARQHGAIGTDQLPGLELGVSVRDLRRLRDRGVLRPAAARVYVAAGSRPTVERDLQVGLLNLGPTAVVSHEAAARLHRFDRHVPDAVEFTVPRHGRGRSGPFRIHTTETLPGIDRVVVDGFPCTSATRTIIDLARLAIPTARLEAAIDSAVRSGATAPTVLARRLSALRGPGRWGAPRIDTLLPDSGGHSPLERRFLALVRRAGLPRPRPQVIHRSGSRTFARVDFLFDDGLVVEVSGRLGHASDAERARDAQRRNELQHAGRTVFEFTRADVVDRPDHVVATLRRRLDPARVSVATTQGADG